MKKNLFIILMLLFPFFAFAEEKASVPISVAGYISVDTPGWPAREFQLTNGEVLNHTIRSDARTEIHFTSGYTTGPWRIVDGGASSFSDHGATCSFFPGSTPYNYIELEVEAYKDGTTITVGFKIFFNK